MIYYKGPYNNVKTGILNRILNQMAGTRKSYNSCLTFNGTVQISLDEGGHTNHPLLVTQVAITVLIKCTEYTIHKEVITHVEVVL